ncbi:DUF6783 domain-containing protein [Roseburia inulinivorans]
MALLFCCFRYPAKLGVQIAGTMFQTHAFYIILSIILQR